MDLNLIQWLELFSYLIKSNNNKFLNGWYKGQSQKNIAPTAPPMKIFCVRPCLEVRRHTLLHLFAEPKILLQFRPPNQFKTIDYAIDSMVASYYFWTDNNRISGKYTFLIFGELLFKMNLIIKVKLITSLSVTSVWERGLLISLNFANMVTMTCVISNDLNWM